MAYAGKIFGGGFKVMAGLVRGPGAEPPGRRRIFENLKKIPKENCQKCSILAYFAKKIQNSALNFRAFGRKPQLVWEFLENFKILDEYSIEKLNFYLFFVNFVAKIETSEITSFFYNIFSGSGRFETPPQPPPPAYASDL